MDKVRAHYEDLKAGQWLDAEVKVLFLGNGGVGKTQLCRRLRGEAFDPSVPTTHGIQLGQITVELDGFAEPVRLNLWDFGGQDIYHGSHALFLHGQAVFLLLWTPELESQTAYQGGELSFRHRPLPYWLDYLRAFAGTDASVLIVQSQCDSARDRASHPPVKVDDFFFLRWLEVSAKTGLGLNLVKAALEESDPAISSISDGNEPMRDGLLAKCNAFDGAIVRPLMKAQHPPHGAVYNFLAA